MQIKFKAKDVNLKNKVKLLDSSSSFLKEIFADIKPIFLNRLGNIEDANFGHIITENYYQFTIRYDSEINVNHNIEYLDKQFSIKRIINLNEEFRFQALIAQEVGYA